jgi:threonine aldolase
VPGVKVLHTPQANSVFAELPRATIDTLHDAGWRFYEFIAGGGCRLMCSWDTTPESVDAFAAAIAAARNQ